MPYLRVNLTPEQILRVQDAADTQDLSLSAMMRQIVDAYFAEDALFEENQKLLKRIEELENGQGS